MAKQTTPASAWLPFALCALLTCAAAVFVGHAEHEAEEARFANDIVVASGRIEERMGSYMALLRASAGLLSTEERTSPEEFRLFADRLNLAERYPGTQGIGYTVRFGSMDVSAATAAAHANGWENITIWPDTPRDEVHAIVMLEPLDARNRAALGYDMHTEPARREAMDRARDTSSIALTSKVTLVQEIEQHKQPGFLLYAPVYTGGGTPPTVEERRAKLKGYVYAPLRAGDLFAGIFGDERPDVAFELYDGGEIRPEGLLFASREPMGSHNDRIRRGTFTFGDHVWSARFTPTTPAAAIPKALRVMAFGILLSAFVLLTTLARERARAREVVATAAALASEEQVRLKDLFIGVLGHDLRNPLNAIVLTASLLRRRVEGDKAAVDAVQRIQASAGRMARMIDQLLDLARARLGGGIRLTPKRVALDALVHDAVDEVGRGNPACRFELDAIGDLEGEWDPDRLAQVFSNLLGNAARHHEDASIDVRIDGTSKDTVTASVHNAAVIAAEQLPLLFQPFATSSVRASRSPGLGIGLYITRAIVEAHGGTVDVTSNANEGTTFTVVIPRRAPRHEREARDQEPTARHHGAVAIAEGRAR